MAGKTATITIDGREYTVHRFNVRELREVMGALADRDRSDVPLTVLEIAMRRAEPKIADFESLEPDTDEVATAMNVILEMAGMRKPENPPEAAAS